MSISIIGFNRCFRFLLLVSRHTEESDTEEEDDLLSTADGNVADIGIVNAQLPLGCAHDEDDCAHDEDDEDVVYAERETIQTHPHPSEFRLFVLKWLERLNGMAEKPYEMAK